MDLSFLSLPLLQLASAQSPIQIDPFYLQAGQLLDSNGHHTGIAKYALVLRHANGTLIDDSFTNCNSSGSWEEGYHAMVYSIANGPQPIETINLLSDWGSLAKNIILVSDEDRDASFPTAVDQTKTYVYNAGYI